MSAWMSLMLFSLTTTMRGMRLATRPCIFTKLYQRPMLRRLRQFVVCAISSARSRVIGWCSVTIVGIIFSICEDAVAEALVVVDEVEVALALLQRLAGADAERQRLAERALEVGEHLDQVALAS